MKKKEPLTYRVLRRKNIQEVVGIFHQDSLKYATGDYPEAPWISTLMDIGYVRGLFDGRKLMAALASEGVSVSGVYLWIIAVDTDHLNQGYGQILYDHFEAEMTKKGKEWIFLTANPRPETFYLRNGFATNGFVAKEFLKLLAPNR